MASLYFAIYLSTEADPTDGQEVIDGAWGAVTATATGSDTSPTVDTTDFQGATIPGLTAGESYKLAAVWDDGVDTSAVEVSGVFWTDNTAQLTATESGGDTASFEATVTNGLSDIEATLTVTESGSDTASFLADTIISTTITAAEIGGDVGSFAAFTTVTATLGVTESGSDTAAFNASVTDGRTATLTATESGKDIALFSVAMPIGATLTATETGSDTPDFQVKTTNSVQVTLQTSESGSDIASFEGTVILQAALLAQEQTKDEAAFSATVSIANTIPREVQLQATETGSDVYETKESMAVTTSGTAQFSLEFTELAEEAWERAGKELRTGYQLATARRSMNLLLMEWANRGVHLFTLEEGEIVLTEGESQYTLPADTVDILEHTLRRNDGDTVTQSDRTLTRIGMTQWAVIPNKLTPGEPVQLYVERRREAPVVNLWPIPNSDDLVLVYWRMRRIQDAGNGMDNPDVPFRFYPALVAGLAYNLAMKDPELAQRAQMLKGEYDSQFQMAEQEDRERATMRMTPRVGRIG